MTSLARRQLAFIETLLARPREQGVEIGFTFGQGESQFEVYAKARTFESFLGHAGEMTTRELNEVVDRLVIEANREPEGAAHSPLFRVYASNN